MSALRPGLHRGIDAETYHADPCPEPSLSSSIARVLLEQSAAHAFHAHPRLGGAADDASNAADLGTVCHTLALGRGRHIEIIDADDWRTKAAKEARDAARAAGRTPVLARVMDEAEGAVRSARRLLAELEGATEAVESVSTEVVAIWREGSSWCRAMVDILPDRAPFIYDLKFTGRIAEPMTYARTLAANYAIQAAFYPRGIAKIDGAPERELVFVVVETDPPYSAIPYALSPELLEAARDQVDAALRLWRRCMEVGEWPGYPSTVHYVDPPPWLLAQWRMRAEIAAFRERVSIPSRNTPEAVDDFIDNADMIWRG